MPVSWSLRALVDAYVAEVTPSKGVSKRGHDRRARRVWLAFFDAQAEPERRSGRSPATLDRTDWDRFVAWRGGGRIPGWRPVRGRQVQYDLKFLLAVLNWGTGHKVAGRPVLGASPWSPEVRRSQRWEMPRESRPHRPSMTTEVREALVTHAPSWQLGLALVLGRETRRRNASIRRLRWSDVDLDAGVVRWRGEHDKSGRESVTPLSPVALRALEDAPSRGSGDGPVFPSASDPRRPTPRNTFQVWLRRAKERLLRSLPADEDRALWRERLRGVGYHAEKRTGVRDPRFRALPAKLQEAISGTSWETLRKVYDEVGVEEMREAMRGL